MLTAPRQRANNARKTYDQEQQYYADQLQRFQAEQAQDELKFQIDRPDMVHSVGLNQIKEQSINTARQRNNNQAAAAAPERDRPLSNKYQTTENLANRYLNNLDGRTFQSLIVIANTNSNANLGVSSLDADLLKSFLALYMGQSVDTLLRNPRLQDDVDRFNREHEKSYSSNTGAYDKSRESVSKLSIKRIIIFYIESTSPHQNCSELEPFLIEIDSVF